MDTIKYVRRHVRKTNAKTIDKRNLVMLHDACPACGERDADRLVWDYDGTCCTCVTCGKYYKPRMW